MSIAHHQRSRFEARLDSVSAWVEKYITPPLVKLGNQRHFLAIRAGLTRIIPIIVIGAVPLIITNFPIEGWADVIAPIAVPLNTLYQMTFGFIGLWAALSIGAEMGRVYKLDPVLSAIITASCFMLTAAPANLEEGVLPFANFGAGGLFTAILIAVVVAEVTRFMRDHKMVITMPAGVPANIAASFSALFPLAVLLVFFWLIRYVFSFDLTVAISTVVSPLLLAADSWYAALIAIIVCQLLWFVGIHGGAITFWGVLYPFLLANVAANAEAAAAGEPLPHVFTEPFLFMYGMMGGVGSTLPLVIFFLVLAKSARLKQVGKLSIGPALFNINEPVTFGTPIAFNPVMLLPWVFGTSAVGVVIGYAATSWGWVSAAYIQVPWTTPPFINAWLATGGDWRAVVLQAIIFALMAIVWFIFFRIWDGRLRAEELALAGDAPTAATDDTVTGPTTQETVNS
ncbi:PTS sugar transporter subunit IIC [Herbiconiux sp. VKM Ac-1786]|uniref:PTS sugar transporter subunit IIC n=1 Tax=Herbiconiux sp. VKM Ac-1786 TaxID=2783824 RepID=UPI00188A9831|nr:PTS transporter subunit EIIC [Herbiconiux sp. VKM Ac-1786]MBF4571832.1 PTS sugar transporter subunit IIC [Herbiconiux sp. VKM Ac-1786]